MISGMWFWLAFYFALATAVSGLVAKKLLQKLHPLVLFFVGQLYVLPLMLVAFFLLGGFPTVTSRFYEVMLVSSTLDAIAFTASIWGLKLAPLSLIAPMSAFSPAFTVLFGWLFLGEMLTLRSIAGIFFIVAGAYLLNLSDIKKEFFAPFKDLLGNRGVQLTFVAYSIWGITPILQKDAIGETSPLMPFFPSVVGMVAITFFILPFSIKHVRKEWVIAQKGKWLFVTLALIGVTAQFAAFTAFSLAPPAFATAIFKLSILFSILFGWLFLKEGHIQDRLLGAIVMLLGTALLVL